jgi:hypothetical protein
MGMAYDPSNVSITGVNYAVNEIGDPFFIPAYPVLLEEQRDEPMFFSENGELNADGTARDLTTAVQWTAARFDAYKAAALAQTQKQALSIAQAVNVATNEVEYDGADGV